MDLMTIKGMTERGLIAALLLMWMPVLPVRAQAPTPSRPPAIPLVTHDPYFSVWSMNDHLTDDWPKHWTGTAQGMQGLVRIDGKPYRFAGAQPMSRPPANEVPAMKQTGLEVWPTRTVYHFETAALHLQLTFLTPALPHDLEIYSRPVTYVSWEARSIDGIAHAVTLYFDVTGQWVVNNPEQTITWSRFKFGELSAMAMGTREQPMLAKSGDNLRIDWGYLYVAVPPQSGVSSALCQSSARRQFVTNGTLPDQDDLDMPRAPLVATRAAREERLPVLATMFDLGQVGSAPVSRHLLLAYDDLFSIEYFNRRLRPYWRKGGMNTAELLRSAEQDYPALVDRCRKFDEELTEDLQSAGGHAYAAIAVLAYRQALAAHKLVADFDGTPLYFAKENFSNGCIATVDVTYPSSPLFLLLNPALLKAQIRPILDYASTARWRFPFAPHDLGTYPLANGQVYGGGEKTEENQMPVEESGNMLLLVAALSRAEGDTTFAHRYWPVLSKWADYLRSKGLDPENQLCTDDFAGHLAHNTNLSLKAIVALGAYAKLAAVLGKSDVADNYAKLAKEMAVTWIKMADDGDHFRLAFDKPGSWSQKYNLVWDRILDLNLFPADVHRKEVSFYLTKQNRFGLPLDNRKDYTKLDWVVWTATLADTSKEFQAMVEPVLRFVNESPDRVPLTDWYDTVTGKQQGFQARSVVGGVYVKLLSSPAIWKKWRERAP
jgi:hypothetical protein